MDIVLIKIRIISSPYQSFNTVGRAEAGAAAASGNKPPAAARSPPSPPPVSSTNGKALQSLPIAQPAGTQGRTLSARSPAALCRPSTSACAYASGTTQAPRWCWRCSLFLAWYGCSTFFFLW